MARPPLLACAVYISSSAAELVSKIAARASSVARVAIVDTFVDASYARSSVKIVGEPEPLEELADLVGGLLGGLGRVADGLLGPAPVPIPIPVEDEREQAPEQPPVGTDPYKYPGTY